MDDVSLNLSKLKQPEPSFSTENKANKKTYNFPKVGALPTPNISTIPDTDEYIRKRNEYPQLKFKETFKKIKFLDFQNTLSAAIVALGILSFKNVIKDILGHFKK